MGAESVRILREGVTEFRGEEARRRIISGVRVIVEAIKSSLGPRGLDKMFIGENGEVLVTRDGATMLRQFHELTGRRHPAARLMHEIAKATRGEVGDGTTSAVVLTGALVEEAEKLMAKGFRAPTIIRGYKLACAQALRTLHEAAIRVDAQNCRWWLMKIAKTCLNGKLTPGDTDRLAKIAVDAALYAAQEADGRLRIPDTDNLLILKKPGGRLDDSLLVRGIVINRSVVSGSMPKRIVDARIALLACSVDVHKTWIKGEVVIDTPEKMKAFMVGERNYVKEIVDAIVKLGATVVISQRTINTDAQNYLSRAGVLAVHRVPSEQGWMERLARATGGRIITRVEEATGQDLGWAKLVEERWVGKTGEKGLDRIDVERWVFIEGCREPKAVTILVRGGNKTVTDEAERALRSFMLTAKCFLEEPAVVVGGGAVEAHVANKIRAWSRKIEGREQLAVEVFAKALEAIPLTIADNAGISPSDVQIELRASQAGGCSWRGVNTESKAVEDLYSREIFEPLRVKAQVFKAATEVACALLKVDYLLFSGPLKEPPKLGGTPEQTPEEG